jgi:hypothetical protein
MESRLKFKIGAIEFEAEGNADVIERERNAFMQFVLPAAVDAVVKTGISRGNESYIDVNETNVPHIEERGLSSSTEHNEGKEEKLYDRMNLASFVQDKGVLSEQDFVLFAAYFDEKKNSKTFFTKEDVDLYYSEARRIKPSNVSMCLNQLAKKGYIMDADASEQKVPKPYILSSNGIKFIEEYIPKDKGDNKGTAKRSRKKEVKKISQYVDLNLDQLNLEKYPSVSGFKNFKDRMILLMYIMTEEEKGEWFSTSDILFVMTDLFGEPATKDQVNGVFNREKIWFKSEKKDGEIKRKLLSPAKEHAKGLITA